MAKRMKEEGFINCVNQFVLILTGNGFKPFKISEQKLYLTYMYFRKTILVTL